MPLHRVILDPRARRDYVALVERIGFSWKVIGQRFRQTAGAVIGCRRGEHPIPREYLEWLDRVDQAIARIPFPTEAEPSPPVQPDPQTLDRLAEVITELYVMAEQMPSAPRQVRRSTLSAVVRAFAPELPTLIAKRAGHAAWVQDAF